jgi:hypothetical protein
MNMFEEAPTVDKHFLTADLASTRELSIGRFL